MVYICGFLMACADSVPGVSGGTIAYILGVYETLLKSISIVFSRNPLREKKKSLIFIGKLGACWIIGMIVAIKVITSLLIFHTYDVFSLFLGFVAVSIPVTIRKELPILKKNIKDIYFVIIGAFLVVILSNSSFSLLNGANLSFGIQSVVFFIGGILAISALLLPGLSGSTILLILGLYSTIIGSVSSLLTGSFTSLMILIPFALGVVFGGIFATKLLKYALEKHRSKMVFAIQGLLIGSLYAIIMGPQSLKVHPMPPMSLGTFKPLLFILGTIIILLIEQLPTILEKLLKKKNT